VSSAVLTGFATIGYSKRKFDVVLDALRAAHIEQVIGVRLKPTGRDAAFRKEVLRKKLEAAGIAYVHIEQAGNRHYELIAKNRGESLRRFASDIDGSPEVISSLIAMVRDKQSALLCVCLPAGADHCHRGVLVERMLKRAPDLVVEHLLPPIAAGTSPRAGAATRTRTRRS
jgi:uncharacterized protein (DUF488 family)